MVAAATYEPRPEGLPDGMPNISVGAGPQVVNLGDWPYLTERKILGIPAVWRCVNIVGGGIATMPQHCYRGLEKIEPQPRLLADPHPTRTRTEIWFSILMAALLHGNGLAILSEPDRLGFPQTIRPVHPLRMAMEEIDGEVVEYYYRPRDNGEGQRFLSPEEVLHIRWLTPAGDSWGMGVLAAMQRALQLAMDQREHASGWFGGAAIPSGILQLANPNPSQKIVDDAKALWQERHGGPSREVAVLPGDVHFQPLGTTPEATQLLASRQLSNLEIANMFGVPPHMLGANQPGQSLTYQNVEQEGIDFLLHTLLQWVTQIEEALSRHVPRTQRVRLNVDAVMRVATLDRSRAYQIALGTGSNPGWLTVDEVRALEGRLPLAVEPPGLQGTPELGIITGANNGG
jgi:HK97 family phage portal protein